MSVSMTPGASETMRAPWGAFSSSSASLGRAQESGAQQHRRLEADAQRLRQFGGQGFRQGPRAPDRAGVVDQRGAVESLRIEALQPCCQARRRRDRIGEVLPPLFQHGAGLAGARRERVIALTGNAQKMGAGAQQLLGHGAAQAARCTGEDGKVG
jgi:hypothetical protein